MAGILVAFLAASVILAVPVSAASPDVIATDGLGFGPGATVQLLRTTPVGPIYLVKVPVQAASPGTMLGTAAVVPLATSCWTITWSVVGKDLLGYTIWQYNHQTNWCTTDGKTVAATPAVNRYASNMASWWTYSPVGGIQTWWGINHTSYRSFSQGHMQGLCSPFGCDNAYPWVDQTVWYNGTVTGTAGA